MKINEIIVEAGLLRNTGIELWRRSTMLPDQKRELEQMESMLVKLTKLPLEQVQKNSKDILKKYKELLNQNDTIDFDPIDRANVLAVAIEPFYPEVSKKIMNAYNTEKYQSLAKTQQPVKSYAQSGTITPSKVTFKKDKTAAVTGAEPASEPMSIGGDKIQPGSDLYNQIMNKRNKLKEPASAPVQKVKA